MFYTLNAWTFLFQVCCALICTFYVCFPFSKAFHFVHVTSEQGWVILYTTRYSSTISPDYQGAWCIIRRQIQQLIGWWYNRKTTVSLWKFGLAGSKASCVLLKLGEAMVDHCWNDAAKYLRKDDIIKGKTAVEGLSRGSWQFLYIATKPRSLHHNFVLYINHEQW